MVFLCFKPSYSHLKKTENGTRCGCGGFVNYAKYITCDSHTASGEYFHGGFWLTDSVGDSRV